MEVSKAQDKKHPLVSKMENARFFMLKAPNVPFLLKAIRAQQWCFTKKAIDNIKKEIELGINMLFFVSVLGTNTYQGAFTLKNSILNPVKDEWIKLHIAQYEAVLDVQWLSFPELYFSQTQSLMNPLRDNEPLNKFRDCEEVTWDLGSQLCKLCIEQEKANTGNPLRQVYKNEYIKWAKIKKEQQKMKPQRDD